ncbi:hypothetical protein O3M35_003299 [Rhynocoris fuscipes]|uniref:Uncharacterized protein n=1 Tax=Rhynocoris fuscipes TaxID=488301 RepID=A0AAW1CR42_9HEMI
MLIYFDHYQYFGQHLPKSKRSELEGDRSCKVEVLVWLSWESDCSATSRQHLCCLDLGEQSDRCSDLLRDRKELFIVNSEDYSCSSFLGNLDK